MDVHLVELECLFKEFLVFFFPLGGFCILKIFSFGVHENACDALCRNVVLVDQLDLLQRVRRDHFKVCIGAFEIIETFCELRGKVSSAEVVFEDFSHVHDHLSFGERSVGWPASKTKSEVLTCLYISNDSISAGFGIFTVHQVYNVLNGLFFVGYSALRGTDMEVFIVDFPAAREESQLITVGIHLSDDSNFGFDIKHLVPGGGLVKLVQEHNLLTFDIHAVASEDVQNQKFGIAVCL